MVRRRDSDRLQTEAEERDQLQDRLPTSTLPPQGAKHALKEHWSRSPGRRSLCPGSVADAPCHLG